MKSRSIVTGALVVLSVVAASSAASAAVINFNGPDINMGSVADGQTGIITDYYTDTTDNSGITPPPYIVSGDVFGTLPTMSEITFTYTLPAKPPLLGGSLTSNGSYGPNNYNGGSGIGTYYGSASSTTSDAPSSNGYFNGNPSVPLVLATTSIVNGIGTTTIQNDNTNQSITTTFASLFTAAFTTLPAGGTLTYKVSGVPLPAALPLFTALIAGMIGFGYFKRQRNYCTFTA